jgi:hypothetical protein
VVLTLLYVNQWAYKNEEKKLNFYFLQSFIKKGLRDIRRKIMAEREARLSGMLEDT